MIGLVQIAAGELPEYVEIAFAGDEELQTLYHISPGDAEHIVSNTMQSIKVNAAHFGKEQMKCYKVATDNEAIGYSIIIKMNDGPDELFSFGIGIKYRTPDLLKEWVARLKELLSGTFYLVLWSKNTRAIDFFKRNGMREIKEHDLGNDKTLLICRQVDLFPQE